MRIFLVSALALFLELLFIRWIGTEINIFAYLQNTILVVCFLGLGAGCFSCRKPVRLERSIAAFFILTLLLAIPQSRHLLANISLMLSAFDDLLIWQMGSFDTASARLGAVFCGLVLTLAVLYIIWQVFVPLGRILGRLLDESMSPLRAYSLNILGSMAGVWLFVLLSVFSQPPYVWCTLAGAGYFALLDWKSKGAWKQAALTVLAVFMSVATVWQEKAMELKWSPYQKLSIDQTPPEEMWFRKYAVLVNNIGFQCLMDFRPETLAAAPESVDRSSAGLTHYDIPFLSHPAPKRVLIVGAGTGTDIAAALRHGAEKVVAVEIDPVIISFGKKYHPEHPYDSPKVSLVNSDARAYFATSTERFDVIDFGLLDSHTTPVMTNIRLDHFVYTKESIEQAYKLLAPGGVISLAFNVQRPFIADRIAEILKQVTGADPLVVDYPITNYGPGGTLFIAGDPAAIKQQLETNPRLKALIEKLQLDHPVNLPHTTEITTDDWPYLYLPSAHIPKLYWLLGIVLGLLMLLAVRRLAREGIEIHWSREHCHFALLGAAFMLFEVEAISRAAAVLGATWLVNAVIITGVLIMILAANALVMRFPRIPNAAVYVGLFATCLALYLLNYSVFQQLEGLEKMLVVGLVTTCPLILSGIVFAQSFSETKQRDAALGANLIGSLFGGVLQSVTFVVGIKAVLLLVIALYCGAMLTRPRSA